jgi:hypothetical protein
LNPPKGPRGLRVLLSLNLNLQAHELSEKKYCSVMATVSGVAEVSSHFQIEAPGS